MDIKDAKAKELSESAESLDKREFLERVANHQTNRKLSVPRIGADLTFVKPKIFDNKISDSIEDEDDLDLDSDVDDDDDGEFDGDLDGWETKEGDKSEGATGGTEFPESIIKIEDYSDTGGEPSVSTGRLTMAALERLFQQGCERQSRGDIEEDFDDDDDRGSMTEERRQRRDTEILLNIMQTEMDKRQRRGSWKSVWDEDDPEEDSKINEDVESDPVKKLLWAAENNEIETARDILDAKTADISVKDDDGYTPLHRATYNGHAIMVEFLLGRNADICACTTDGWQPIHCAARWNNPPVASLLIQAGCDVNAKTNGGQTALHLAASNPESEEVLNLLLMHRYIDVTIKNGANETAYDIAQRTGRLAYLFEMRHSHMLPSKS